MAMDLKWLLSADDKATPVFDKLKTAGTGAADGIMSKFNLVSGAVAGMAAIAAGGVFSSVIKETIAWTIDAIELSKSLGITTEKASVLNVALGDVYLTKDVILAGSSRIAKALKTEEDAFTRLGVATRDQTGHYRNTLDIMTDVNSKLGSLKEGTDRNVAGMSIYGRSWSELSLLIRLNNTVMDEAKIKAKELGLIVGEEQVAEMKKYKASMNDIEDVGKSLALRFGNVLLPMLLEVGAFLGKNGPLLAEAFRLSLTFLGKTVTTLGEWLGLMASRAVSAFSIIKSAMSGNFAEARQEYKSMVEAGEDFNKRTKDKWANWADKPSASKGIGGDVLDLESSKAALAEKQKAIAAVTAEVEKYSKSISLLGKNELELAKNGFTEDLKSQQGLLKTNALQMGTLEQPLRNYIAVIDQVYSEQINMQKAVGQALISIGAEQKTIAQQNVAIATTEKGQAEARLNAWSQYLANIKAMHATTLDGMKKKQQELFDIQLKTGDLALQVQQQLMTPMQKYYSTVQDLDNKQKMAMSLNSDEKIKMLSSVQDKWAGLTGEIKDGDNVLLSQTDAVAASLAKIQSIGSTMEAEKGAQIGAAQEQLASLDLAMKSASDMVTQYQTQIHDLDGTIAALTRTFDLTMTDAASPVINQVKSALDMIKDKTITITANYVNTYSSAGSGSGDGSIPQYASGTPYVPRTGLALIHQGERITTARDNAAGNYGGTSGNKSAAKADTYHFSGNIVLPNVTNQTSARELFTEFQKLARRQAA